MTGVITGFGVICSIIATGYLVGRWGVLGEHGREALTKLAFYVATPALLFRIMSGADLSVLTSPSLAITAVNTVLVALCFTVVGALRRWGVGPTTIGALCSSYVNAGNLGIPIATYVLGDATLIAPVLLFQQLVMMPIALTLLDLSQPGRQRRSVLKRLLVIPFRNPVVIGSLSGVAMAAGGWTLPGPVMEPFILLGSMAVPAVLLAFGISLRGSAMPARGAERGPVLLAVALKAFVQPAVAWVIGAGVFGADGRTLLAVVVTAALPAAQNLFTYATRYDTGVALAREAVLLSTIAAVPVLAVIVLLLG